MLDFWILYFLLVSKSFTLHLSQNVSPHMSKLFNSVMKIKKGPANPNLSHNHHHQYHSQVPLQYSTSTSTGTSARASINISTKLLTV